MEINESFGKVESLINNIPSLETELNSDNNEQIYYDYNIKRNIEKYD